ncbi:hypothetical protein ACFPPD_09095 [Cohnella suwonensis]|uniref:SLH domain-containing protein n=1 Tax=Cohnella suwonensis TaxID=696072 RepID=A0ABW0LVL1_9BACL
MQPAVAYAASTDPYTDATFRALVDAIVPSTAVPTKTGMIPTVGAVELHVHEYMIWELDHSLTLVVGVYPSVIPLAAPTAMLLNAGAVQLIASGQAQFAPYNTAPGAIPFAALSPSDRIRTLALLESSNVDPGALPPPYQYDLGLVKFMVDFLNRQTMFGTFSEWSAYGTTRLMTPTRRRLEYFPISWRQVGYPGVSLGYRALLGFPLTIVREGGVSTIV